MAERSATTSSAEKSVNNLKLLLSYALQLKESAVIIADTCTTFWVWHCPSVTYERTPPPIGELVVEFFGKEFAEYDYTTRELVITGLFTEDDKCP